MVSNGQERGKEGKNKVQKLKMSRTNGAFW